MRKINLKGITPEAVTGVLILFVALVNAALQIFDMDVLPVTKDEITDIVSTVFLILAASWNTWKNRNVTSASQIAQNITDAIKNGEILEEEVKKLLNKSDKG